MIIKAFTTDKVGLIAAVGRFIIEAEFLGTLVLITELVIISVAISITK